MNLCLFLRRNIVYMIQRIQSLYLLFVIVAVLAFLFLPYGGISLDKEVVILNAKNDIIFIVMSAIISIVALVAIFLFKNRKLQLNVVMTNVVLSFVVIGIVVFKLINFGFANYTFGAGIIFPIFILFFNLLAYNGIKSDERLVKSMDRLR